ncbi:paraquat-inducible protein A [Caballeronia sordidicola]|uniref:Paraquat-inducible protein A n=1 Tax=Caballeronia sordidicola TaxID=196367 RepID=A0A242M6Y2_CABSO|nr:paraquat-inducible protein A [Caballeronia sordidicola]OTP66593.1 Paraquat-inducible protein A [Caballeronia sordidicola]
MKTFPSLIICEHCDTVYRHAELAHGESAHCARCNSPLYRGGGLTLDASLALSVATAVAFLIANICPAVRIGFQGLVNEATLWQATWALWNGPEAIIAVPAALMVIVVPFIQLTLLVWLLGYAKTGRRAPGFAPLIRFLAITRQWGMVEIALLGVLVTMVKLAAMLHVQPLAGIWAMAVSMLGVTMVANRDTHRLWSLTETRSQAAHE